jgi:hypothetical protein
MDERYSNQLRTLVDDHYHGLSTFDSYREQRTKLLDALENETAKRGDAARSGADREAASSAYAEEPCAVDGTPGARGRSVRLVAVVSIGLLLSFATVNEVNELEPDADSGSTVDPAAARGLLERFLARDDWATESLSNFQLAWDALSADEREQTRTSDEFVRFERELRRRLEEPDDAALSAELDELASAMGIARAGAAEPEAPAAVSPAELE